MAMTLRELATELNTTGMPPSERLIEEIRGFRAAFRELRSQLLTESESRESGAISTLSEMEVELSARDVVRKAIALLETFSSVRSSETRDEQVWQKCVNDAEELKKTLSKSAGLTARETANRILLAEHPLGAAIKFVTEGDVMTDDVWFLMQEQIAGVYGRELATAIARGRLKQSERA